MSEVQSHTLATATPSQVDTLLVELDDEQLASVSGGVLPVGGWSGAESTAAPVGGW